MTLRLQAGGDLDPRKHIYIVRPQDQALCDHLRRGDYCNVLSSRQMGKSSAKRYAQLCLTEQGIAVADIDIAGALGTHAMTADTWCCGLLTHLCRQLDVREDVEAWWRGQGRGSAGQRLQAFIRDVMAPRVGAPIVLFIDEIDSALGLPFADDFFLALRAMYNDRAREPAYKDVTFCLLGVALTGEFIRGRRTPYNIGVNIELHDFRAGREDLSPLVRVFEQTKGAAGHAMLEAILAWTDGHPFLTADWCRRCLENASCRTAEDAERLLDASYKDVQAVRREDTHFQSASAFIDTAQGGAALALYRRIVRGKAVTDGHDPAKGRLKLSGLVKRDDAGRLVVRNRIYQRVFDRAWMGATKPRRAARRQRIAVAAALAVVLATAGWASYTKYVSLPAQRITARVHDLKAELRTTTDPSRARDLFLVLCGDRPDDMLGESLHGHRTTAEQLYREFQQQHIAALGRDTARRFERDQDEEALILAAYAAARANTPVASQYLERYEQRGFDQLVWTLRGHQGAVHAAAFTPDSKLLVTASKDGTVKLWDMEKGLEVDGKPALEMGGARQELTAMASTLRQDGLWLTTVTYPQYVGIWKVTRDQGVWHLALQDGKVREIDTKAYGRVRYGLLHPRAPDTLVTIGDRLVSWRVAGGLEAIRHEAVRAFSAAYSPDGEFLAVAAEDDQVLVFRRGSRHPVVVDVGALVSMVEFDPRSERMAASSSDGKVRLWRLDDLGAPPDVMDIGRDVLRPGPWLVTSVSFCNDGSLVSSAWREHPDDGMPGVTVMWDAGGTPLHVWPNRQRVFDAELSPDCRFVGSGQKDGVVRVWRTDAPATPGDISAEQRWRLWQEQLGMSVDRDMPVWRGAEETPAPSVLMSCGAE